MADDTERLRALEREFFEHRGEVRLFMTQSLSDRTGLHLSISRSEERNDERHKELLAAIVTAGNSARDGLKDLADKLAVERQRIDAWENRAEGASWIARWLPGGVGAAIGAALTYFAGGTSKLPPGGMP